MSTPQSNSRPIAPAPPTLSGSSETGSTSPGASPNEQSVGIKRASTACQSCKQIKRKCDQAQPCSNCRKSHTRCIYNEAEDGRRKAARKRTVESLELKRDALDSILESLRTSDDQHVQRIIQLIRSQTPLEEITRYAANCTEDRPGSPIHDIVQLAEGRPRKTVLSVNALCDTPFVRVPSKPWTNATSDDEFVSHLISLYFTWFHIAYPLVDKALFLRDISAANLDCQFCSPLLVNAMLTMACHFSDHPRACSIPSESNTRGRHFLEEAIRLWNEQEGRPSLLNIQAISILSVAATLMGKDRLSLSYLDQMNRMKKDILFKASRDDAIIVGPVSTQLKTSQTLVESTTFLLMVGYGSAFMRPDMLNETAETIPKSLPLLEQNITWFPYPQRNPEVHVGFNDLHQEHRALHEIGLDIQRWQASDRSSIPKGDIGTFSKKLDTWKHSLPHHLQLETDTSIISPPVMDLHLTYHWFRITLFNFVKRPQNLPDTSSDQIDSLQSHSRVETMESAQATASLYQRYAKDFGYKQPTMWMPQTALSAAHSIIDMLSDPINGSSAQDIFHEFCLVLVAASQRWLVMKGHVRMLFVTAEEKGKILPQKTKDLLKFVALDKWGDRDHLLFASALYPNYSLAKDEDPRSVAMGDLLEKWASYQTVQEGEEAIVTNAHILATDPSHAFERSEANTTVLASRSIRGKH